MITTYRVSTGRRDGCGDTTGPSCRLVCRGLYGKENAFYVAVTCNVIINVQRLQQRRKCDRAADLLPTGDAKSRTAARGREVAWKSHGHVVAVVTTALATCAFRCRSINLTYLLTCLLTVSLKETGFFCVKIRPNTTRSLDVMKCCSGKILAWATADSNR